MERGKRTVSKRKEGKIEKENHSTET